MTRRIIAGAALILAAISAVIFPPTGEMIVSMPWKSLFIAFMMMIVFCGLEKEDAFRGIERLCSAMDHTISIILSLMAASFILAPFLSSAIAALMIPIAEKTLTEAEKRSYVPRTAAFIAGASAAGGFLLPTGSLHNLIISGYSEASIIREMALPSLIAIAFLAAVAVLSMSRDIGNRIYIHPEKDESERNRSLITFYACLAFVLVLTALSFFGWADILIFFAALTIIFDRSVYRKAPWALAIALVLYAFALTPLRGTYPSWLVYIVSELAGSFTASLISSDLIAVNAGALGLIGIPSLIGAARMRKEGMLKEYAAWYAASALPVSIAILLIF